MSRIPYYSDDWVTIWHGDVRDVLPGLGQFGGVITSPPYNLGDRRLRRLQRPARFA